MSTPTGSNAIGRRWAYAGLGFGAVGSVVANVAHAMLPPATCLPETASTPDHPCLPAAAVAAWSPSIVAIGWGITVAAALVIITQVLERIEWPDAVAARIARFGGGGVVALVAAATSYYHLSDLLLHAGREWEPLAYTGPALVDGVMMICSFALIYTATTPEVQALVAPQAQPAGTQAPDHLRTPAPHSGSSTAVPAPVLHAVLHPVPTSPVPGVPDTNPEPFVAVPHPRPRGQDTTPNEVPVSALRRTRNQTTTTVKTDNHDPTTTGLTDAQIISHLRQSLTPPSIRAAKTTYNISQNRATRLIQEAFTEAREGNPEDHLLETEEEGAGKPAKESHLGTTSEVGRPDPVRGGMQHTSAMAGDIP